MILTTKQVFSVAPQLGVCVAVRNSDGFVVGHCFGPLSLEAGSSWSDHPSPDLLTVPCNDRDFVGCEAVTPDGEAFLALMSERS